MKNNPKRANNRITDSADISTKNSVKTQSVKMTQGQLNKLMELLNTSSIDENHSSAGITLLTHVKMCSDG